MDNLLNWYPDGQLIQITFAGQSSIDDMMNINRDVCDILDDCSHDARINVLLDMTNFAATYRTSDELRQTQLYPDHPQVDWFIVLAPNKVNRLITNLAFSNIQANFMLCDSHSQLTIYLKKLGIEHLGVV